MLTASALSVTVISVFCRIVLLYHVILIACPVVFYFSAHISHCTVQGRSDGGISVYIPPAQISQPYKFLCGYWLFFFLFDPGQIVVDFEIGMT